MNASDVSLQILSVEHLGTERAMFAHIIMNSFDVSCQNTSMEHLRTERAMFAHVIMNFFDVSCQVVENYFFSTARALFLDSRVDNLHVPGKLPRLYLFLHSGHSLVLPM